MTRRSTALSRYGEHVGLAFQIVDDILDVEESSEALGKTAGKDAAQGKITFPAVYGLEESRAHGARRNARGRTTALAPFGERARAAARNRRPDRAPQDHEPMSEGNGWTAGWWTTVSPNRARKRRR